MPESTDAAGELILYTTEDGAAKVQLRAVDGTVWLTQREISELFDKDVRTINEHIQNVFADGESDPAATIRKFRIVQTEGAREVSREVDGYNLDVVLAVGYRVRSERGAQFRQWATTTLREYLVKGFVMNDEKLKDPQWDYFDELLERIREIRASEARFYQKVREILTLSEDYDPKSRAAQDFYAVIQNRMLYAVTGHTASELISTRANADAPNMGLTSFKTGRVRKSDVATGKNYLTEAELRELNLIVTMFLDTADLRARRRQTMRLADWAAVLQGFLEANELPVLTNAGNVSASAAEKLAHARYAEFDAKRKDAERAEDRGDIKELERIAKSTEARNSKVGAVDA